MSSRSGISAAPRKGFTQSSLARSVSRVTALWALLIWVVPTAVSAQVLEDVRYSSAIAEAQEIIRTHVSENQIPGLSIAVSVGGELVWAEGFGTADVENQVPVTPQTKFRIASISKALTSAALGKLYEEGKLDLDAEVQAYVPSFPRKDAPITVRQVAGHLAGIRHYNGNEFGSMVAYDDVVDALAIFEDDPLVYPPGDRYSYSTYGWNLISAVIQGASGVPFLDYMQEEVIEPLDLDETQPEFPDEIIGHRARFYQRDQDGTLINAPYVNNSNKWAGGGYLSTARDMVRYGSSFFANELVSASTKEVMFTSQRNAAGEEIGYGLGWRTGLLDGRPTVWHTGGAMGGSTVLLMDETGEVAVSILTNIQNRSHTAPARAVANLFIN